MKIVVWGIFFLLCAGYIQAQSVLTFNGNTLRIYQNNTLVSTLPATAGRPFFRSARNQFLKNIGPLPEGRYYLRLSDTVWFGGHELLTNVKWMVKYIAWGNVAIPIDPSPDTRLKGRHSFMIHGGGWIVGSKGCIVVYGRDTELLRLLSGKSNVSLVVAY